ncbi:MAG: LysM peptidoglycan-binding domain-containing M23 family metallopeptidase [Rhodobacteraceae bacterium]|nr:LysM peptidoglycan-binding domain-containing M23 family metallopeptidase [Paracoccaceae bacterium]
MRAMPEKTGPKFRPLLAAVSVIALAGCDPDLRSMGNGFDTTDSLGQRVADLPEPDDRGVISYPNYQVALARRGDTVTDVANRVGLQPLEVARYNGIPTDVRLREGEVIALPSRVAEPSAETGAISVGPILPAGEGQTDITALASSAIDRAEPDAPMPEQPRIQTGMEPIRHKVASGETAYSIARLYRVSVRALADWNSLGPDLSVRVGQYLLIPVVAETAIRSSSTTTPGVGTPTPVPPSSAQPLPTPSAPERTANATPSSPELEEDRTAVSDEARFIFPVQGRIIRPYKRRENDGIDIAADTGTQVRAAAAGTVAAITRDTDQVPILVLRHEDGLLTVYAGLKDITVAKGDTVGRGQVIAKVNDGEPSFLHFEVRQGFDSVDPMPYLE